MRNWMAVSISVGAYTLSLTESVLAQYFTQRDSVGLGRQYERRAGLCCCHTSCLHRQAVRICCHQSYNSCTCKGLLHKSVSCLNSQGTKGDLLFVQPYPIFSISRATVFMRREHSNRHHHKTREFRLGILVWRSFITVHSFHMLSHHHEPFQIY